MQKTLTIDKTEAYSAIQQITGYTGRNTTGGIDRISATDDESGLVDKFFARAVSSVVSMLDNYKPSVSGNSITIEVPSHFDSNVTGQLSEEATNFVVNYVCSEWFLVAREVSDASAYKSYQEANRANILLLVSRRVKPNK